MTTRLFTHFAASPGLPTDPSEPETCAECGCEADLEHGVCYDCHSAARDDDREYAEAIRRGEIRED